MFMEKFEEPAEFTPITVSITFETQEELDAIMVMTCMQDSVPNAVFGLTHNEGWYLVSAFLSILKDTLEQ